MKKFFLFVVLILVINIYPNSVLGKDNIDNDEMLLFAVATEENIEKLGLNKSIYDKIVDEYF
jgi:hypothetical protein